MVCAENQRKKKRKTNEINITIYTDKDTPIEKKEEKKKNREAIVDSIYYCDCCCASTFLTTRVRTFHENSIN